MPLLIHEVDAADLLGLSPRQLMKMVRNKQIPFVKLPNKEILFDPIDLELWVQALKARGDVE